PSSLRCSRPARGSTCAPRALSIAPVVSRSRDCWFSCSRSISPTPSANRRRVLRRSPGWVTRSGCWLRGRTGSTVTASHWRTTRAPSRMLPEVHPVKRPETARRKFRGLLHCARITAFGERAMLKLHDYLPSQNGYKVRLLLNHLGIEYEMVESPLFEGAGERAEFLARNPVGAVPVLEREDGSTLPESNAILMYLAEGTPYLPSDSWLRAQVARWMFFEEDYVQNGI